MSQYPDECQLEEVVGSHSISANLFVPFVIRRLCGVPITREAVLRVRLQSIGEAGNQTHSLRIRWHDANIPKQPLGISENTITEWAALGVACVVIALYRGLTIQGVTGQGDRFDYWVSDGQSRCGLEVSGTLTGEVESRHRAKIRQWQENPWQADGYVVTVDFATRQAIFSFHRYEESSE